MEEDYAQGLEVSWAAVVQDLKQYSSSDGSNHMQKSQLCVLRCLLGQSHQGTSP